MTHSISLIAPAKLNLNLNVKDKLKNGYHSLESDVCFLNLYDEMLSNTKYLMLNAKDIFFFLNFFF